MSSISILNYQEGVEQLAKIAVRRELIPFFGAGFTCNCQAYGGAVPGTKRAMVQMRDLVLSSTDNFAPNMLDEIDFLKLAEIFFEYVPDKKRAEYFERYYTEVELYKNQKDFLVWVATQLRERSERNKNPPAMRVEDKKLYKKHLSRLY